MYQRYDIMLLVAGGDITNEVFVHLIDFKGANAKETVTSNEDGSFSIFINSRLNQEQQTDAYLHALSHITRFDFENRDACVDHLEYYAHNKI